MTKKRFGEAEVEVSIRNRVGDGLKAIERRMKSFGAGLQSVGGGLSRIGVGAVAAFGGIGASLVAATSKFAAFGDTLDKTSARTGVGVGALAELGFAAEQSGTDLETVEKAFFGMSRSLFDASRGSKEAGDALKQLGINYKQIEGLSPDQQFQAISDGLATMTDESKRGAVAQKLFGRAGRQILPMVANVRELREEARNLGLTLSKDDTNAAAGFVDAMNRAKRTVGAAVMQIGAALAPALTKAADAFTEIATRVVQFIRDNRGLVVSIAAGVAAGAALGAALVSIGGVITAAGIVVASLGAIFTAVGAAIAFAVSPLGLIIGGVVALTGVVLHASGGLSVLGEMFVQFGETAKTAWGGIVAALGSGDLKTAGAIAFAALEVGWLTLSIKMQQVWAMVTDFLRNVWLDAVQWIIEAGTNIYFGLAKSFDQLSNALIAGFDVAFVYIKGALDQIVTAIAKAIIEAQRFFGILNADTAAGAKQILDDDLARRAGRRQSGLESRASARGAGLAERDAARRATREGFLETLTQDLNRRRSKTIVDDSQLKAGQAKLAELSAKAQAEAAGKGTAEKPNALQAGVEAFQQAGLRAGKVKALGTSSAAAVQAGFFGSGTNKPNEETAQNTRKIQATLQKMFLQRRGFQ